MSRRRWSFSDESPRQRRSLSNGLPSSLSYQHFEPQYEACGELPQVTPARCSSIPSPGPTIHLWPPRRHMREFEGARARRRGDQAPSGAR